MSDGVNDLVSELSNNKPMVHLRPDLACSWSILIRQAVDFQQLAFIISI
jgi:hypothetical protein